MARELTQPRRRPPARAPPPIRADRAPSTDAGRSAVRFVEPRVVPIEKATDLGSVQVLKHGNLYLLTDPFGDIHPDSRGLGPLPLRHAAAVVLRRSAIGGARPVAAPGLDGRQLPRLDPADEPERRPQPGRQDAADGQELVGRTLGIARDRLIGGDGAARSGSGSSTTPSTTRRSRSSSSSARDDADIFEVRGYPRPTRGTLLPIAVDADAGDVPLRRPRRPPPLDPRRLLRAGDAFGPIDGRSDDQVLSGGAVRFRWDAGRSAPGDRARAALDASGPATGRRRRRAAHGRRGRPPADGDAAATLFPEPPRIAGGRGRRRPTTPGTRSTTAIADRPRAVQPDAQPRARRPAPADQRRPRPGPALRRGRRAVVRDAVRPGRDHHRRSRRCAFRPQIAVETLDVLARLPGDRGRRLARRRARQDPPRAADRRDGRRRRAAAHAVLRLGRLDAALADPARRDLRLDRRPGARRPPLAERAGRARLDRPVRRPRRRRLRRVRAALDARACSTRAGRTPATRSATGTAAMADAADRARRGPGLRLRREAPDRRPRRGSAARTTLAARLRSRGRASSGAASRTRSGSRTSATTRWPSTARSGQADAIGSNAGPVPLVRDRRRRPAPATSPTGCWARRCSRAGGSGRTPPTSPATTRSATTPGRSGRTTRRSIAAGLKRYGFARGGEPARRPRVRGRPALRRTFRLPELFCGFDRDHCAACRCRTRSPARRRRGRPARRSCSSRRCSACGRTPTGASWSCAARTCPTGSARCTLTNLRVGDASVDLLFHRWRGTTSAEVLRKVGDVSVTIRL